MPKIYYPDNFKIEVVKHYKMHRNIDLTLEKYGIARSTLFKWKKKYEENHFFGVSKKSTDIGHKAKAHLDKLNKIVAASKELRWGVTASITEKVTEIKRLEGKYSVHVLCEALQIPTFSAPGYPYDNSVCESFFNKLKKEATYYHIYDSAAELAAVLDEYIEYYNEVRMHRTLKMKTPSQVKTEFFERVNL